MSDGFLSRWSRRKAQAREGLPLAEPPPPEPSPAASAPAQTPVPVVAEAAAPPPPPPTLEQAQALTPDADFKPFLARGVAPEVKNEALRKLFADPRFNVMDGLDVYIDDYSLPDPLPAATLRQMASARFLQLVEDPAAPGGRDDAHHPQANSVAQCGAEDRVAPEATTRQPEAPDLPGAEPAEPHHADTDLRLQQDHAARRESARPGPS